MPSGLRRRSLLLLQGLSAEAVRRGCEVRKAHSFFHPREGGVDIAVDGLPYTVSVRQEFPQSLDPDRSSRLVVELAHGLTDRPPWPLARSEDPDARRGPGRGPWRDRGTSGTRRPAQAGRAAAIVEREVRWRAAMEVAKEQAVREQLAQALREEAGRWQESAALSAYCTALERRIGELHGGVDEPTLSQTRRWLEWARAHVRSIDPLSELPKMPDVREPTPEELKPCLRGGSPDEPERRGGR